MTRLIALMGGLTLASPAWAFGIGSSYGFGGGGFGGGGWFGNAFNAGFHGFGPSLDLHFQPVIVQIHALEFVDAIANEEVYLGANVYVNVHEAPISNKMVGVVQPGGSLDLWADPGVVALAGTVRLGAQLQESAGVGVYVVPTLGFLAGDGDTELIAGGSLQISAWFGR